MSKRRRTCSVIARHDDEDLNEASTSREPLKKKKKLFDPIEACHQLYETIRNHKKNDGTLLCDSFIRVPKRRQEPGYYDVVNNPIDLLKVQQKLKTDEYNDIHDLETDIELIVANTKAFYKKNSQEWKDADELWNLFLNSKSKILSPGADDHKEKEKSEIKNPNHTPKPVRTPIRKSNSTHKNNSNNVNNSNSDSSSFKFSDDPQQYEELFNTVMTATDDNKMPLNKHFQLLPSKSEYPEYYEVIEQPLDLKRIAIKIQNNRYPNILALEKDLVVMCKNACLFNEPNSLIYSHAKQLKKIVNQRRIEIMDQWNKPKASPPVNKSSSTPKRQRNYIAIMAKLKNPEGGSDSEENGSDSEPETPLKPPPPSRTPTPKPRKEEVRTPKPVQNHHHVQDDFVNLEPENPQWKLLETVWKMEGADKTALSEPFWKLPSRRIYPDYYREIKNPMSLTQIRNKLTKKLYGTVSEVAGDMTVMFENAKKYNVPSSKLYKDAVKLQKVMQAKVQALLDIDQKLEDSNTNNDEHKKKVGTKPKNLSPMGLPMRGRPPKEIVPMKRRLYTLAKYMLDFTCEDGRQPMLAFMEKPSKKLYPEYYEVIEEPIDFLEIESKIKAEQYSCEKDLVMDFQLMFSNCRQFNEENSPIYEDANLLEKHLMDKVGPMFNTPEKQEVKKEKNTVRVYKPRKTLTPLEKGLKQMYEAVRDYRDSKGRQLSQIFVKLPSRVEYPDYYEVIKHPIDMERIAHKMKNNFYEFLEDMAADFTLMLDNACKFNEPDSQIYKDALVLQRVVSQKRLQLKELAEDEAPDVAEAVQDILLTLFTTVYNHQDDEGRCYSDSMAELPEHDEIDGKKARALSLDLIKRRLDRNLYKRLDLFQSDFFACLDRARRLSRSDSQVFEDSIEMQMFFIKMRDELCKQGELLQSPALTYTALDARHVIEKLRHQKSMQESLEEDTETRSSDDSVLKEGSTNGSIEETMTCNHKTFQVGEFVYLESKKDGCEPHILKIEKLFEKNGQQMLYGNHYFRPDETYHVQTRRFLEKEVFKSDQYVTVPLEEIKDRCCVLSVKQYFTMKPEGYDDNDVYVVEFRYSSRHRAFKKMKIFPEVPSTCKLVNREVPLEPKRVMSIFKERLEKHKDELAELQVLEGMIDDDRPNVVAFVATDLDDGNTYYEQYNTICSGVIKTGDFVYVVVDGGRQVIAQIDSIWDTTDGKCYFRGPWFLCPTEVPNPTNKLYYKNEVLLSTDEDINPIVSIIGRCSVLDYNDYVSLRPTEIPEQDVYICTSIYDEISRQIRKLPPEGLRKYYHLPDVVEDELYYFSKLLNPSRVDASDLYNPKLSQKLVDTISTKKSNKSKVVTGYILYSREVRKQVVQNNPESKFGDISRIVGSEWKALAASEKQVWEERASKLNEETKAQLLAEQESCPSPAPQPQGPPENQIFECKWEDCDFQFEDLSDCVEHSVKDSKDSQGHVQKYYQEHPGEELQCKWRNCSRLTKKNLQPFPNITRLIRHVRDMHINKGNGRVVMPDFRSKNFKPSTKATAVRNLNTQTATASASVATPGKLTSASTFITTPVNYTSVIVAAPASSATPIVTGAAQKSTEPMFLSVPPRPQRVLHSEAYIKYIEGLNAEQKHISNWERTLHATPETCAPPDPEKLSQVATWLGKRADQHDNVVAALWQLRNQLLKDTLCLHKTL
ncbi:protein polybromo-1 isoform X2 [Anthonomus grandis grandis]|uniref:protein polybromo-1 isoform X2 n=1 Tax=Anthonomus grandis grandis TaxID=2921223 RepID=UPI002165F569|nr:protein polybromo-1 isoform X2 [Anthonomus grandis grandis]